MNLQDMRDVYRYGANPPVLIKDEDERILAADYGNSPTFIILIVLTKQNRRLSDSADIITIQYV